MKSPIVRILLLCLCIGFAKSREITHEDIKDAMLSLVHMMRENTEKLERHEAREKQVGEQTKKAIALLTKRVSTTEGLKILEERMLGLEQMMIQRDERERIQLEKIAEVIKALENRLTSRINDVENIVLETNDRAKSSTSSDDSSGILAKLSNTEVTLATQVAKLESGLDAIRSVVLEEAANQNNRIHNVFSEVRDIEAGLVGVQTSLQKLEDTNQRMEERSKGGESPNMSSTIEEQNRALARVATLLEETSDRIRDLPRAQEVHALHNDTQLSLQETKHVLKDFVVQEIHNIKDKVTQSKEETRDLIDILRSDLTNDVRKVSEDLRDLEKGQSVMVSMADHVLDTKKRVEYGVHQILLEVGDLVKTHSININDTLNNRFDGMSNDILDNQNGALANLTIKMEQEMNQVWRQINAMYQQMMESAKALDKLHEQSEAYVAGTTSTMGGMESKVGEITKRMLEVDENLNYLLGRLSLVTQEFNQIKTGLGAALDNIKASFKEVEDKANDLSPGPHPVPEHHQELDENPSESPSEPQPEIVSRV